MIVYVAGSSRELERAGRAMRAVERAGHSVALDWVRQILEVGTANPDVDDSMRLGWARSGLSAVGRSDRLWLLVPQAPTSGAWIEFGFWLACQPAINTKAITSGPGRERSIFTSLADHHFDTDEFAAAWLATQKG